MPTPILNTPDLLPREQWDIAHTPSAAHLKAVVESAALFNQGMSGRNKYAKVDLMEAMATADFNILLGQAFEIELLATYEAISPEWQKLFTPTTVKDFKPKKLIELFGGRDPLEKVGEGEEYRSRAKDEGEYFISAEKFGNTFDVTWELIKNDELDGLSTFPDDLAQAAIATEDYCAFGTITTPTGPNAAYFRAPVTGENRIDNSVDNKPLNADNLEAAYLKIVARRGPDGRPINTGGRRLKLVVPQSLELQAQRIVNTPTVAVTDGNRRYDQPNPIFGKFDIVVSYWVSLIDVSAKSASTWYITGDPAQARPALALAKMRGEENPDIRVKADTGTRLGGGSIDPAAGSYTDDTISYRGRHVVGAAGVDPITTYASVPA